LEERSYSWTVIFDGLAGVFDNFCGIFEQKLSIFVGLDDLEDWVAKRG
jgi:hypothetical protein